jgi:hypothetical protein
MAYVNHEYCRECEQVTHHINQQCTPCAERKRRAEIAAWNALTTEEKLQDLRRRVEILERPEPRY